MDTIFTKIITRELPAYIIYEDEEIMAFLDAYPIHPGHVLIIPKHPYQDITTIPSIVFSRMALLAQRIAHAVLSALHADGVNIIMNNKPAAGQVIFHAHIHVIPRFINDGLPLWHGEKREQETYTQAQAALIQALQSQEESQ